MIAKHSALRSKMRSNSKVENSPARSGLEHSHEPTAIRARLNKPVRKSYLRDAIYGSIDGAVTTFAVVSGVSGAGLPASIVIVLGVANLVGDGFSMAAGNFLGTRAENQRRDRLETIEKKHIEQCPEGETEEIRQILRADGYSGDLLEQTISHVVADQKRWIKTMLEHEYGVSGERLSPVPAALTTFVSFLVVGTLPLLPFVGMLLVPGNESTMDSTPFMISSAITAIAFLIVGAIKSKFAEQYWLWSALETLGVGAIAAGLAYGCGYALNQVAGL